MLKSPSKTSFFVFDSGNSSSSQRTDRSEEGGL